jgi:predicted dehydrogenase
MPATHFFLNGRTQMKLRVGVVGLGEAWDRVHRPAIRALSERFEIRAVCDAVRQRADLAATEFGADAVDGYRQLAAREDVDVILLSAARWCGALPVLAACEYRKAIYFAGGLDIELPQAQTIQQRVAESGITFVAEFPRRQSPATLRLKELIATRLGSPRLLFCHRRLPITKDKQHVIRINGQPTSRQELLELVDWCRYVVGSEPHWVTGVVHRSGGDVEYRMMSLDFSADEPGRGAVAQISCGRYIPGDWSEAVNYRPLAGMQVSCEHGIAFVDLPSTLIWFDEAGRHQESLESERPVGEQLLMQLYRAVTNLVGRPCDLDDACRALFAVEQAEESFHQGRRLAL